MGARGGGGKGALAPLELEKMTSYVAVPQNTLKFLLAPSALVTNVLYFSLKRRKKRNYFRLRLRRAEKWSILVVLPPLEKFLRAPMHQRMMIRNFEPNPCKTSWCFH